MSSISKAALLFATTTTVGLALSLPATAASLYSITDLGASSIFGADVNDRGQAVGLGDAADGTPRAFIWENNRAENLGTPEKDLNGMAYNINNQGQVVGYQLVDNITKAFIWQNGVIKDLGSLNSSSADDFNQAFDINEKGQVVGTSGSYNTRRSFLWQNGAMQDLGVLGNTDAVSAAGGINNLGQVVGRSGQWDDFNKGSYRAFLWQNGAMQDLGALKDTDTRVHATSINDLGQVVGQSGSADSLQAFIWQNGVMKSLSVLDGDNESYASAINNKGQVVGLALGSNSSRPFLWQNGVMQDINSLIPSDSGWNLLNAYGINDSGDIVGAGIINRQLRGFILKRNSHASVPEAPMTFGLLGLLTQFCILKSRRKKSN